MPGAVTAVRILLWYSPAAFLFAFDPNFHPALGLAAGAIFLFAGIIVACRYRVSAQAVFQSTPHDLRKLYGKETE